MSAAHVLLVEMVVVVLLNLGFRVEVQEFTGNVCCPNAGRSGRKAAPAFLFERGCPQPRRVRVLTKACGQFVAAVVFPPAAAEASRAP